MKPPYRDYTEEPLPDEAPSAPAAPRPGHGTIWIHPNAFGDEQWMMSWQDEHRIVRNDTTREAALAWARAQPAERRLIYVEALDKEVDLESAEAREHLQL